MQKGIVSQCSSRTAAAAPKFSLLLTAFEL